jgi:toxin ParE1/3/4
VKPAWLRPQAEADLIAATEYYASEGGAALGGKLFDSAIAALATIEHTPSIGSPRLGELCEIPGLRSWGVTGLPQRWFYFERAERLDIVRLLGERPDIAAILSKDP